MTPNDKLELQVQEEEDGSAVVELPENEDNPQIDPPEPSGRVDNDPDDEVDEERQKIREQRREERRLKKQIHREKTKESSSLISALKKQNEMLAERVANMEKRTSGAELARVDKAIEDASVEVEYAKMKMEDAVTRQDGKSLTAAQESWFEAKRKQESLQAVKKTAIAQTNDNRQAIQPPTALVQKLAAEWMEEHSWYDPNMGNEESQIAKIIDQKLTKEGYDPETQDYWDELTDRVTKILPDSIKAVYNESNNRNQRPRSVVTSSGRETMPNSKGNAFVLSPERVSAMKESGAWDDPARKMRMINYYRQHDKTNKVRG